MAEDIINQYAHINISKRLVITSWGHKLKSYKDELLISGEYINYA